MGVRGLGVGAETVEAIADRVAPLCPRCKGARQWMGHDCRMCGGDGRLNRTLIVEALMDVLIEALDSIGDVDECARQARRRLESKFAVRVSRRRVKPKASKPFR